MDNKKVDNQVGITMTLLPAIATVSLGRSPAGHDLREKIMQASRMGFKGIELFFECLETTALQLQGAKIGGKATRKSLLEAARLTRAVCEDHDVKVVSLQPFMYFEGQLDDRVRIEKFELLEFWFELARLLDTNLIQIPSNFQTEGTTSDMDCIVADLSRAAELGAEQSPPIRFSYEGISWGTHIDTWEQTWEVVQRVNRPNFGLCLDIFHVAGRVWADPAVVGGVNQNADDALHLSLQRLVKQVLPSKIFYIQLGDAERLSEPLVPGHPLYDKDMKPRMSWSRNARLFPFETDLGGYLPVETMCNAIFSDMRWTGWVSMEMFHRLLYDTDQRMPEKLAGRAAKAWAVFSKQYSRKEGEVDNESRL